MALFDDVKAETAYLESTGHQIKDPTEDESNKVQIMDAMEVSGEAGSSIPKKRKADVACVGEETNDGAGSDDGDGSCDESDEDDYEDDGSADDCGSDWETDSSDSLSCDDDDDDVADEERRETFRRYDRQIHESKGFHVDPENVPEAPFMGVRPITDLDAPYAYYKSALELMERLVRLAFDKYNREKGTGLEMVKVVKANVRMNDGPRYYITCMARESADGEPKEYQVKVERKFVKAHLMNHFLLCRPAPRP